jgi:hypothetical protein
VGAGDGLAKAVSGEFDVAGAKGHAVRRKAGPEDRQQMWEGAKLSQRQPIAMNL